MSDRSEIFSGQVEIRKSKRLSCTRSVAKSVTKSKRLQTWCHRRPVETPTSSSTTTIRVEVDVHGIGLCRDDWRHEVMGMGRRDCGVATAPVHQGCPVPICDFDMAAWACVNGITDPDSKVSELQPQYLPTLYLYCLCLVEVERVVARVVWRGDNTCGRQSFKLDSTKGIFLTIFSTSLTLVATVVCSAKWRDLPDSGSSGRVRDTSKADPG